MADSRGMNAAEYHARPELSSSQLVDFMESPRLYWMRHKGNVKRETTDALEFGTLAHKLILEGEEAFWAHYANGAEAPVNPATGKYYGNDTKKYTEWASTLTKPVAHPDDVALAKRLRMAVHAHPAKPLGKDGKAETVVFAELYGVKCRAMIDWIAGDSMIDLKTTADVKWITNDIDRLRYVYRLAFYRDVYAAATGGVLLQPKIVAVEKKQPYAVRVLTIGSATLDEASRRNRETILRIAECERTNFWPTGYEAEEVIGETYADSDATNDATASQPQAGAGKDSALRTPENREVNAGRAVPQALDY
jgi:hypothetical protein